MEYAKKEIAILEQTICEVEVAQATELSDLQLLLVGGGAGDVVFA